MREEVAALRKRVYPRVCGGTFYQPVCVADAGGLSPRMRGNQYPFANHGQCQWSIPAYAGEPGVQPCSE